MNFPSAAYASPRPNGPGAPGGNLAPRGTPSDVEREAPGSGASAEVAPVSVAPPSGLPAERPWVIDPSRVRATPTSTTRAASEMGLDFVLLFLTALFLFWLSGRVIDDIFEEERRQFQEWRERQAYRKDRAL